MKKRTTKHKNGSRSSCGEVAIWVQNHLTPKPSRHISLHQVSGLIPSQRRALIRPAVPPVTDVPSLGPALDRIAMQLAQLTTSHSSNVSTMNSLARERNDLDQRETEMREMVTRAEDKRAWFSSFNDWVEGVAGFLDEKVQAFPQFLLLTDLSFHSVSPTREA